MKTNLIKRTAWLAAVGATLVWAGGGTRAYAADHVIWTFDGSAPGWTSAWGGQGDASGEDPSTGNPAGSLQILDHWAGGDQCVYLGWFNGSAWSGTSGGPTNLLLFTNIVFNVMWDTADSSVTISQFNSTGETLQFWAIPGDQSSWIDLGNVPIPADADTGWKQVNLPINNTIPGIDAVYGLGFKKYTGTGQNGDGVFWVDNITLQDSGAPPGPPTLSAPSAAIVKGLNIYDDGNAYDRQNIATVVTNTSGTDYCYAWIGNSTPVTYSVHVAKSPDAATYNNYQIHVMIVPGRNITETAPDWNEANALVWFIDSQTNGSVIGTLCYKLNNAGNNSYLFGSDTNVFGPNPGQPFTNTIVAGYGGQLGTVTNASGAAGTWSLTFDNDTSITLQAPDGSTSTVAFPQESDAQAFTYPVTVYWGTQPNTQGYNQDVVLSGVSISGSTNTLNADLTQPINTAYLAKRGQNNALIFSTPTNAVYWLQWTLPDAGFALQTASSLSGTWSGVAGPPVAVTNLENSFDTSNFLSNIRNYNPPPIAISYDFGDDAAATVDWVSGPTYDAGGNSGSGSVQLKWTWAGGSGNEAFTMDIFSSGQNLAGGTLSFDIMIDPSSTAGTNNDYGYLDVVSRDGGYGWNPTGLSEALLTAAGGTVGTWAHISIPLGTGAASTVRALTFQITNDGDISGSQTIYIDNLQLTGEVATGPITYTIGGKHSVYITSDILPSTGAGFFRMEKP